MAIASNDSIVIAGTTTSGFGDYVNRGGYDAYVLGIDTTGTTVRVNFGSEVQFGTSKDDFGYGVVELKAISRCLTKLLLVSVMRLWRLTVLSGSINKSQHLRLVASHLRFIT
jgi:hypothetical protein